MNAEPDSGPTTPATGGAPWSFEVVSTDPLVVSIGGELDTLTGPHVREGLIEALGSSEGPVRIELAAVTFIDSQGLSMLIGAHHHVPDRRITIAGARPNVRRLIDITGLDQIFDLE
jgi:anti-sigma B factor antagonist